MALGKMRGKSLSSGELLSQLPLSQAQVERYGWGLRVQSPPPASPTRCEATGKRWGWGREHQGSAFNKRSLPIFYDLGDRFITLRIGNFSWDKEISGGKDPQLSTECGVRE